MFAFPSMTEFPADMRYYMTESQHSESNYCTSPLNYDSGYDSPLEPSYSPPLSNIVFDKFLETLPNQITKDDQDVFDKGDDAQLSLGLSSDTHSQHHSSRNDVHPSYELDSLIVETDITRDDVLCGRGVGTNTHPGNMQFRALIREYRSVYFSGKPFEKSNLVKEIVMKVRDEGGRFLRRQETPHASGNIFWYDIGYKAAREKVCQALRDRNGIEVELSNSGFSECKSQVPMLTMNQLNNRTDMELLVQDEDVLLGREKVTKGHSGNQHFRSVVLHYQEKYLSASKLEKTVLASR